ncbi:MAG: choice-of-anchor D domain-containing protein [Burkholderiaceae bacterium]
MTGTGTAPTPTAPAATLSPLALDFGMLPLSTPSSARTVSLMNSGSAPLSLTALSLTGAQAGDYAKTTNCPVGGTLGAGSTCVITLTFTPTVAGARVASLTVMSNAAGAPTVDLKGMGVVQTAAVVQVAPTQVAFGRVRVGKTSDEREVRIRNMGTTPLAISSIATTGDFTKSSECHATLAPGKSCEVKVRFKPTATGSRIGELTVASNASGSPHAVKLSGFGAGRRTHGEECEDEDDDEHACSQATAPFGRKRD